MNEELMVSVRQHAAVAAEYFSVLVDRHVPEQSAAVMTASYMAQMMDVAAKSRKEPYE